MIQTLANLMQVILILLSLAIVLGKSTGKLVIYLSAFSLITASLYFLNAAPDVAIAEVAIGSAIMPLLYIISISKQQEFIVITHVNDKFLTNTKLFKGEGYLLLKEFTRHYKLKLIINHENKDIDNVKGIFRKSNVDLIIDKNDETYYMKCKSSSILMSKLEQMTAQKDHIKLIKVKEGETDD